MHMIAIMSYIPASPNAMLKTHQYGSADFYHEKLH